MRGTRVSFYNLAWRWHFYAGLFVAPFMILLALTGLVYLFKPQLDPWLYRDLMVVEAGHHRQGADVMLAEVRTAYPEGHVGQYLPPLNAQRSAQFVVHDGGRELNVFVDPYSGKILGEQDGKRNLQAIARALHGASDRAGKPFVAVNCGALPANLVESILFGHEKGSFTGATDKHLGKFMEANGGTLFLDEIGELPLDMQVKLLRALQEGEIDPVGAKRAVKVDVRIVSATNRDPAQQVKEGAFREDLFYRLNVFPIEAPALRERREDIPALVEHFIARFNVEEGKRVAGCAVETMALLQAFDWPGNVRQLENAIYRALVLADSPLLQPHDFPAISGVAMPLTSGGVISHDRAETPASEATGEAQPDSPVRIIDARGHLRTLEEIERDLIQHAIEVYSGHMSEIARRLGIGRSTLYRKVREQGLEEQLKEAG